MARIFRQRYTRLVPPGSCVERRKGWDHIRIGKSWYPLSEDGRRYICETKTWYMEYRDEGGKLCIETTRCKEESTAASMLAATLRRVEQIRAGVLPSSAASTAKHAGSPLQDHFDAWIEGLTDCSESYRYDCRLYFAKLTREIGWSRLVDLTYDALDEWMRGQKNRSARSRNAYREVMVSFASWCVATKRLAANPFVAYPLANAKADPRHERRAFTDDELRMLLDATDKRSVERGRIYRVLVMTGLRVGELRSLRVRDFDGSTLTLRARSEKARRGAVIPLRADLAAIIGEWTRGRIGEEPLLKCPKKLSRRMIGDLRAAKIEKADAHGRVLDVHSLRHTFATALARAGVAPRVAQQLMRHSTIHLTMNVYTDSSLLDGAKAVEQIKIEI